jgi:hypothetical protein
MLAFDFGGWAAIVAAAAWGVLVIALGIMLWRLSVVMESTRMLVDDIRRETVPLLEGSPPPSHRSTSSSTTWTASCSRPGASFEAPTGSPL